MLEFIAIVMDVEGNVPLVGDADEGVLLRLVPESGSADCGVDVPNASDRVSRAGGARTAGAAGLSRAAGRTSVEGDEGGVASGANLEGRRRGAAAGRASLEGDEGGVATGANLEGRRRGAAAGRASLEGDEGGVATGANVEGRRRGAAAGRASLEGGEGGAASGANLEGRGCGAAAGRASVEGDEGGVATGANLEGGERGAVGVFRSLLATGATLFRSPALRVKGGVFDDKSRWLLGDEAAARFASVDTGWAVLPVRRAFPEGGYFVLGEALETSREVRIVADAGPLGYLAIAAHGHADALAFTLSVAGKPILVDPGTFSYSEMPWRHYFRSTAAHNTVVLDDRDQSGFGGSFLWLEHANAVVEAFRISAEGQTLVAHHDGYRRLPDPVSHRRTWQYTEGVSKLTIRDELVCRGQHSVGMHWHFAPECAVTMDGGRVIVRRDGVRVTLDCPDGLAPEIVVGREQPPLGWFSKGFDVKSPAATAVFGGKIRGNAVFETVVLIERH